VRSIWGYKWEAFTGRICRQGAREVGGNGRYPPRAPLRLSYTTAFIMGAALARNGDPRRMKKQETAESKEWIILSWRNYAAVTE
jgi:hypothetical protein